MLCCGTEAPKTLPLPFIDFVVVGESCGGGGAGGADSHIETSSLGAKWFGSNARNRWIALDLPETDTQSLMLLGLSLKFTEKDGWRLLAMFSSSCCFDCFPSVVFVPAAMGGIDPLRIDLRASSPIQIHFDDEASFSIVCLVGT